MKTVSIWGAVMVVVLAGVVCAYVWAQAAEPAAPAPAPARGVAPARPAAETPAVTSVCPCCGMAVGKPVAMLTGGMKLRQQMLLGAKLSATDPAAILALADQVKLTSEQTAKLDAIVSKARADAEAVLTVEQKAKLTQVPAAPACMLEMQQQMLKGAEAAPATKPAGPEAR